MKKIYFLWLRQVKKYLRARIRIVGTLFEPVVFLLVLGYGLGSVFERAGQGNYLTFLVPGIMGQSVIFNAIFSGTDVIWDRQFGYLKETLIAPMSRFEIMMGRTLGSASVATIQGTLVLLVSLAFGFRPGNWLLTAPAIGITFLVALVFTALGTMIGSLLGNLQGFQSVINFLALPMFLLSGALFPLQGISGALGFFARADPLTYGVDGLRTLFSNMGFFGLGLDVAVLGGLALVFLWIGSAVFETIQA